MTAPRAWEHRRAYDPHAESTLLHAQARRATGPRRGASNQGLALGNLCESNTNAGLFQQRLDDLVEIGDRHGAVQALAVDEESRRRIDMKILGAFVARLGDFFVELLVLQAGLEVGWRNAGLLDHVAERFERLIDKSPVLLVIIQKIDESGAFVGPGASRQHESGGVERIERKLPQDELHFARVDIFALQRRPGLRVEGLAMRASKRAIFDDSHRRGGGALHDIRQRAGRHELIDRDRFLSEGGSGRCCGKRKAGGERQSDKDAAPMGPRRGIGDGGHGRSLRKDEKQSEAK
jgi:hypothetical protein